MGLFDKDKEKEKEEETAKVDSTEMIALKEENKRLREEADKARKAAGPMKKVVTINDLPSVQKAYKEHKAKFKAK